MGISIDITRAPLSRQHGDITAVFSYFDDERALFLIPTYRKNAPWFLVAESAAWKYDNDAYLHQQALKACEVLGLQEIEWFKLAKVIHDSLADLIRMPSAPERELQRHVVGERTIRVDGEVVREEEVREEDTAGAVTYG